MLPIASPQWFPPAFCRRNWRCLGGGFQLPCSVFSGNCGRQDHRQGNDPPGSTSHPVCGDCRTCSARLFGISLTWLVGLPTSSSHALIGGYAGAAMAAALTAGFGSDLFPQGWTKTLIFIVVAPVMGLVLGFGLMVAVYWIFSDKSPLQVDGLFRKLQLLSAAAYSLGHGGNDAQKTMGIVAGALYTAGLMTKSDFLTNWGQLALANYSGRAYRHRDWAPISAAGESCIPWGRRSPS